VVSWTWTQETGCDIGLAHDPDGPMYAAVVLAAYSASGHSIFAIAEPADGGGPVPTTSSADPATPPCLAEATGGHQAAARRRGT
jgi:hypothetical protein